MRKKEKKPRKPWNKKRSSIIGLRAASWLEQKTKRFGFRFIWSETQKSVFYQRYELSLYWSGRIGFERCDRPSYWGWEWSLWLVLFKVTKLAVFPETQRMVFISSNSRRTKERK